MQELRLSELKDLLVQYIPDHNTTIVPLGWEEGDDLRLLCDGVLWVRVALLHSWALSGIFEFFK